MNDTDRMNALLLARHEWHKASIYLDKIHSERSSTRAERDKVKRARFVYSNAIGDWEQAYGGGITI